VSDGHRLAETEGEGVGSISPNLQSLIFAIVVAVGAAVVRRKCARKGLLAFWLGSTAGVTAVYVILNGYEILIYAPMVVLIFFLVCLCTYGLLIWLVAIVVPSPNGPDYFPPMAPSGEIEDTHELLSIPRRYQELFAAHREARKRAGVRIFSPRYVRQDAWDFFSTLLSWRAPDMFMRDFRAAAPVLVELGVMPTAQLSAVEAYHRLNVRYVKRRIIPLGLIAVSLLPTILAVFRALPSVIEAMEKKGVSVNLQWDTLWASALAFGTQPLYQWIIALISGGLLGLIAANVMVWRYRRRLEAFGDILTVALAQRHRESMTTQSLE
jgi:hypothetical protein